MLIEDAKKRNDLSWDDTEKIYHHNNGKKVSKREIYLLIQRERSLLNKEMNLTVDRLLNGSLSFEDWQRQNIKIIKDAHLEMMRLGRGGNDRTWGIHYLEVANELRTVQYPAFRKFAEDIKAGKLTEAQIRARLALYAKGAKISYERGNLANQAELGKKLGRRRLGSCAPHCQECIYYAMRGWMPLSEVIPPGVACSCRSNCCCSIETN